ncbi:MAG: tyrosine-type recombinase/integrase [Hominisplanchenecus sp.]
MASITPRKNKAGEVISYQIKVSRGRDKVTGKQLTPYTMTYTPPEGWSARAIEKELQKTAGEFEAACNRGEILTKEEQKEKLIAERKAEELAKREEELHPTFKKYSETYLAEKKPTFAAGTYENYKHALERACKTLGDKKLHDIEMLDIKKYFTAMQTKGANELTGKPYAHKTIVKHYIVFRSMFANAVENGVLKYSPMATMKRPKPRKDEAPKEAVVYTEEQVSYILECLEKEPLVWKALTLFAIDSGCRRGEIIGLKWEEIDFNTGRCNICRNAQYTVETGTYITTPKNKKSRVIYLTDISLPALREWKKEQQKLFFRLGIPNNGFCFTQENGEMMNPQAPTAHLRLFGKKYNLPGIHPHALRHTMATISIANGADVVSVSKKLGHSTPAITLEVYSHANEEAQRRANEALENAINTKRNKKQA